MCSTAVCEPNPFYWDTWYDVFKRVLRKNYSYSIIFDNFSLTGEGGRGGAR